jgi:hypothetical protein
MLDKFFKSTPKVVGIPIAILLVVLLALTTGGIALGAYVMQTVTINSTVNQPLTYQYDPNWVDGMWAAQVYVCDNTTSQVVISNAANVDIPIWGVATPDVPLDGMVCTFQDAVTGLTDLVVPANGSLTVDITLSAACSIEVSGLGQVWTVEFVR